VKRGKSRPRDDPVEAAKDRADLADGTRLHHSHEQGAEGEPLNEPRGDIVDAEPKAQSVAGSLGDCALRFDLASSGGTKHREAKWS
jgi:hypothetical protein